MKKYIAAIVIGTPLICALSYSAPALADIQDNEKDVQADVDAIHKDNAALQKDTDKLDKDRAAKANAKATNSYGKQAGDSLAIGADKTAITEKKTEKKVDQKILEHHQNELNDEIDKAKDSDTSTTGSSGQ